jgi:hypothetical protein
MMAGRSREAFQRFAERRRREDEARRLHDELPRLRTLRLEVEEHRGQSALAETRHVRHVVVDRAPALFILPCGDPDCRDGGHDVTEPLLSRMRENAVDFVVEHECAGVARGARCDRVTRLHGAATFGE